MADPPSASAAAPDPPLHFRGYLPGLDVLRGIAIAEVVAYHGLAGRTAWTGFSGLPRAIVYLSSWGSTGPELFFVLSGFLITGILLDKRGSTDYYRRFYLNRVFRILPAYLLMLAVLRVAGTVSWAFVLACVLNIANMAKLVGAETREYGAFWSLAVEEQFYFLWPVAVRRGSLRALSRFIWIYLVAAPVTRSLLLLRFPHMDMQYKLWGNADWLLAGALVAIAARAGTLSRHNIARWSVALLCTGVALAPIRIGFDLYGTRYPQLAPLMASLYRLPTLLLYTGAVLWVVQRNRAPHPPAATASAQSAAAQPAAARLPTTQPYPQARSGPLARAFLFLGYISYGLYLVHPFVYDRIDRWIAHTSLRDFHQHFGQLLVVWLLGLAASIAVAYLSRRYFEQYFLTRKDRYARERSQRTAKEQAAGNALPS